MYAIRSYYALAAEGKGEAKDSGQPEIVLATADNTYGLSTDPDLQNEITRMIEERTGAIIKPIIPPLASYKDKIATLINSGDVPDVFVISQAMTAIPTMVAREQILDLTGFIAASPALSSP